MLTTSWPYPRIVAHRGGGRLAPENTLAAIETGVRYGHRMIEFDVKLSADGVPFLLHDDTLDRTSNGWGIAGELIWEKLSQLDAGSWFSSTFCNERLALLEDVAAMSLRHELAVNVEIKPTTGCDDETGEQVASAVKRLWDGSSRLPLLSSFSVPALRAAKRSVPGLPRGLLLEVWDNQWQLLTQELACFSLHIDYRELTPSRVAELKAAGLGILVYTVNDPEQARQLLRWGVDAICTDNIDGITADFTA